MPTCLFIYARLCSCILQHAVRVLSIGEDAIYGNEDVAYIIRNLLEIVEKSTDEP